MRPFVPPRLIGGDGFGSETERVQARAVSLAEEHGFAAGEATGRERGHAEGEAAARAALAPRLAALNAEVERLRAEDALSETLRKVLDGRRADRARLDEDARRAITGALGHIFPALVGRAAGGEIARLVQATVQERAVDKLRVRGDAETLARVRDALPGPGLGPVELDLIPDPAMPPNAAEVSWADGGLRYDPAALLAGVIGALTASGIPSGSCENPGMCETPETEEKAA